MKKNILFNNPDHHVVLINSNENEYRRFTKRLN